MVTESRSAALLFDHDADVELLLPPFPRRPRFEGRESREDFDCDDLDDLDFLACCWASEWDPDADVDDVVVVFPPALDEQDEYPDEVESSREYAEVSYWLEDDSGLDFRLGMDSSRRFQNLSTFLGSPSSGQSR